MKEGTNYIEYFLSPRWIVQLYSVCVLAFVHLYVSLALMLSGPLLPFQDMKSKPSRSFQSCKT